MLLNHLLTPDVPLYTAYRRKPCFLRTLVRERDTDPYMAG
jgi:hypothetical protein